VDFLGLDTVVWVLAVLVVILSLVVLFRITVGLWRHTKRLASTMGEAADRVSIATADLQGLADSLESRRRA
jgi:hypothetical protein